MRTNENKASLKITSHVGRDVLQSAAIFKAPKHVVWEYVSNGLQYKNPQTIPFVNVAISSTRPQKITITDNGRGMDEADLLNFFTMHGENIDRKKGQGGRGTFGTGKCAAFGIATRLVVTSIKNGKRIKVVLEKKDLEQSDGEDIPVKILEQNTPSSAANGTVIEIDNIILDKRIADADIIKFIEGHIAYWPDAKVFVNDQACEYNPPPIVKCFKFSPTAEDLPELSGAQLTINVSATALEDKEMNGIAICSQGVWQETTLAESQGKEMAQYIFGTLDAPTLADDKSPIAAFNLSRDMKLNPLNPLVSRIYNFIGRHVEEVRKQLVQDDRARRQTEDQKRLQKEADKIAEIINQDFDLWRDQLERVKAKTRVEKGLDGSDLRVHDMDGEDKPVFGTTNPGILVDGNAYGVNGEGGNRDSDPDKSAEQLPAVSLDKNTSEKIVDLRKQKVKSTQRKGGFSVDFKNMGEEARARYTATDRTIYINLDHPQIKKALTNREVEDPTFQRLAYEVAFCEYAIALCYELVQTDGHFLNMDEPVRFIRDRIDAISRKAAFMYEVI